MADAALMIKHGLIHQNRETLLGCKECGAVAGTMTLLARRKSAYCLICRKVTGLAAKENGPCSVCLELAGVALA